MEVRPVTSYVWSVKNTPVTPDVKLPYRQVFLAAFMVQYKRSAAPPGATISGTLTVRNPNLLDPILLAQAQVELSIPGSTGPSARTWASCPRDASGFASVSGQLLGSGTLECSWSIELLAAGPYGHLIAAGSAAQLMAVVSTSSGREAASAAIPLASVPAAAGYAKPAGACAALVNAFQVVGPDGEQLLLPSSAGKASSSSLLPGEAGGGRAADVVCDSLSLSYGATYGPLTDKQCGTFRVSVCYSMLQAVAVHLCCLFCWYIESCFAGMRMQGQVDAIAFCGKRVCDVPVSQKHGMHRRSLWLSWHASGLMEHSVPATEHVLRLPALCVYPCRPPTWPLPAPPQAKVTWQQQQEVWSWSSTAALAQQLL
jgi:hypothetical protein